MNKQIILTKEAPQPIGPYSQAVKAGGFIFVSGQIPLDLNGELEKGDIEIQTRLVMKNISAILIQAGSSLERIAKATIFLTEIGNFTKVNGVYSEFFKTNPPARSVVQVAKLPKGAEIEIEVIALG